MLGSLLMPQVTTLRAPSKISGSQTHGSFKSETPSPSESTQPKTSMVDVPGSFAHSSGWNAAMGVALSSLPTGV